jgi:hypothetical protein
MKTNGYKLREALKMWELRKSAADTAFKDSLHKFPSEAKEAPITVFGKLGAAEESIVKLQVAQMRYNLTVTVDLPGGKSVSLAEAIKLSGMADRIEKIWKTAGESPRRSVYDSPRLERDRTLERAEPTLSAQEILAETTKASRTSGQLRAALATGNAVEVDITDLNASLFE